ncbi:MAG TPA: sigma-70 family RNA polymerase sigma factor [Candidatus Deferrimicrobium sp.]|nr:sigma-70 family RNA polymerase sigma factor [Candidatus Deferrimicrobium sp.]
MSISVAADLLERIRVGDRKFLAELRLIIERIAGRWKLPEWLSVEDVAQECLLKVMQNLEAGQFEGKSSFMTYVYAVARNTCIDHYRIAQAVELTGIEEVSLESSDPAPDAQLITCDERRIACQVLLALPRECRRLWRVIFFGRHNYKQAAEQLGLTEGTVKRKMWECRQMAREMAERLE